MKQQTLIPDLKFKEPWEDEWQGMPEFIQESQEPFACINFRFETVNDLQEFSKLIGQKLTRKTKSAWYPFKSHWGNGNNMAYKDEE